MNTDLESPFQDLPKLLRLCIARVLNLQIPPLSNDLLRGKRPLRVPPSRVGPPLLHRRYLVQKDLLFRSWVYRRVIHLGCHVAGGLSGEYWIREGCCCTKRETFGMQR